jgi:hypothetical protein
MSPRLVVLLSATLLATGCTVTTDLGKQCTLKKTVVTRDDSGNVISKEVVDIVLGEVAGGQDFIAFGVTECEDLICVREASTTGGPPTAKALGYCSRACIEGSDASACEVTDSTVTKDVKDRMTCRSLLLDTATLERLRAEDEKAYRQNFGETLSPYFCAPSPKTQP